MRFGGPADLIKHNIKLGRDYALSQDFTLNVDPNQIKQVIINLVINAIEAMPHGGSLQLVMTMNNDWVTVAVKDTGVGIPANELHSIFEPFHTNKEKGTGLGLAICQQIINEHQGKISVESKIDAGTTFKIKLPTK